MMILLPFCFPHPLQIDSLKRPQENMKCLFNQRSSLHSVVIRVKRERGARYGEPKVLIEFGAEGNLCFIK